MKTARSPLASPLATALLCVLAGTSMNTPAQATALVAQAPEHDLDALLEQFAGMNSSHRERVLTACTDAALASGAPQVELIRQWSAELPSDLDKLPERTEFEAHDARKYKGGPPRKTIGAKQDLWQDLNARLRRSPAEPRPLHLRPALYEFSTGVVVQRDSTRARKAWKKRHKKEPPRFPELGPEQPLRELLEGVLPQQSSAEEALLRVLDGRAILRAEADFFAHVYCDREANAYEDMTLFDLWAMPAEFEVPDPDARAYAQLIWDDDQVPVPLTQLDHDEWYPRMERSYEDLRKHMFTTRALVAVWFEGRPELTAGYANSIDIMNAAIALTEFDPERMAELLESSGTSFLTDALEQIEAQGNEVWNSGNARRDEYAAGKLLIREAVLEVLAAEGML